MPASLLTEIIFRGAFEVVLYGLGYIIGWLLVPTLSFGQYTVEPWDFKSRKRSSSHSKLLPPKTISADATCAIGFCALAVASTTAYFVWRATSA
jgi:hypothetical protein